MGTGLPSLETEIAAATADQAAGRPWAALLGETIQSEILPRLLSLHRQDERVVTARTDGEAPRRADIAAFVSLVMADDMEQMRAIADRVILQCGSRDALLNEWLTPAALLLGEMWEHDYCDFTAVTLGLLHLDQLLKETASGLDRPTRFGHDYRILLLPAPGEQHGFGLGMVADAFREGGWCVRSGAAVPRPKLARLVRHEWFDVFGLSVTSDRHLKGLAACIRAVRAASCNPNLYIMLGGRAIAENPERTRFLGGDATARDAAGALADANYYMETIETTVTEGLHQSKTRLVYTG
jgi:methylmalonyl-CoA mutase cobalamin-binding subunit